MHARRAVHCSTRHAVGRLFSFSVGDPRVQTTADYSGIDGSNSRDQGRSGVSHILIAEENPTVWHVLGAILERAGFEVEEAVDGRQAVQVLLSTPYPLTVLLNERIPLIDGWQLLRLMTAEGTVPPADRYIFMTHARNLLLPALCSLLR
jgi:PleD family two-component response regulator